jgi:beta-1,4-N-acetylglucosaminyltransferase
MIYVTLGTMFLDFQRLVDAVDDIASKTDEQVVIQLGMSSCRPQHCAWFEFLPRDEVLEIQRHARVIVGHAGIGTALDAMSVGRPFVIVPRLKRFNEHMNDHQIEIADAIVRRGWGAKVLDIDDLTSACEDPPSAPDAYCPNKGPLVGAVRSMVERIAAGGGAGG